MAKICILEDDRNFSAPLAKELRNRGHKPVVCTSGREAHAAIDRGGLDLVVVDGLLPDTNGIAWVGELRARDSRLPVVFVSSFWRDLKSYQTLTQDLGVVLVVHKPVSATVFAGQIDQLLPKVQPSAPVPAALDREFEELCLEFRESLHPVVKELDEAVRKLLGTGYMEPDIAHARILVHNIRGTARSYGLPAVGDAAALLEDALVSLMEKPEDSARIQAIPDLFRTFADAARLPGPQAAPSLSRRESVQTLLIVADPGKTPAQTAAAVGEETGFTPEVCGSAEAAAAFMESGTRSSALMIDLDHLDAAARQRIRELTARHSGIPVLLSGSDGNLQNRIDAVHLGAVRFLEKPLDPDRMRESLRQIRETASAGSAPVLIVDDDEQFLNLAASVLSRNGFSTYALSSTTNLMEALAEVRPELLILDLLMPGISGFDICKLLRQSTAWRNLPIVVTTALTGLDVRVAAFRAGADDYLTKPFVDEELLARIRVRLDRARLEREIAERDSLTGLLLRRPFVACAQAAIADARRTGRPLSICLIDIDHFKKVNDQRGHLAGDRVLSGFGRQIQARFRREDLRGRWGGEEFAIVLPGQDAVTSAQAISRFLEEFSGTAFTDDLGNEFTCTFSGGVAALGYDGATLEDLIRTADNRLYCAKAGGRRQIVSMGGSTAQEPEAAVAAQLSLDAKLLAPAAIC